ncbi:PDGLE domain-containing protein [Chloroflexota bacterium]
MNKKLWAIAFIICLLVATLAPLASSAPDGLERVAEDHGFFALGEGPLFEIVADYVFPGIVNEALATILAGYLGVAVVFAIAYGLGAGISRQRQRA